MQTLSKYLSVFVSLAVLSVLSIQSSWAQQSYRFDVIATSSSSMQVFAAPSINSNGEVAFAGRTIPGGGAVYTDYLPNAPRNLVPALSSQSSFTASGSLQINDFRQVLSFWSISTTNPIQNFLHIIDGKSTDSWTNVAAANGAGTFNDFNEIYASGLAFNNNGFPVFQTRNGNNTSILTSGTRPNFTQRVLSPSFGAGLRPLINHWC